MPITSLPKGVLRQQEEAFAPTSMIDTLYDYGEFLETADMNDAIAGGPKSAKNIAVVGAGAAGLVAAYELSRVHNINVTLYESSDRIGGRMYSVVNPDPGYNPKIFELGCMRFPPTSTTLFHYLNKFQLKTLDNFPDPGVVKTNLMYENHIIDWKAGEAAPEDPEFQRIGKDFVKMINHLLGDANHAQVDDPKKLFDYWAIYQDAKNDENKKGVVEAWQKILDTYKNVTFYEGILALGQDLKILKQKWTQEDMNRFGALGVGSGGMGSLFPVNFVEMIRLFANGWEDKQRFLESGIVSLVDAFKNACIMQGVGINTGTKVAKIKPVNDQYMLIMSNDESSINYDAVIVATTTRAMEYMGLTVDGFSDGRVLKLSLLGQGPKVAIRNLHLMNSSKFFVTTRTKFWYKENNDTGNDLPANMQTDELMRGLYCLDYDTPTDGSANRNPAGKGVVLISYVWGDDSSKLLALTEEERYQQFLQGITKINPTFAKLLDEQREDTCFIDWENSKDYYGAFKINYPGQEQANHDAFFQFQAEKQGIFIAGDSVSFAGGWLEGAMPTGVNAACAAVRHVGGRLLPKSPLVEIDSDMYSYGH